MRACMGAVPALAWVGHPRTLGSQRLPWAALQLGQPKEPATGKHLFPAGHDTDLQH